MDQSTADNWHQGPTIIPTQDFNGGGAYNLTRMPRTHRRQGRYREQGSLSAPPAAAGRTMLPSAPTESTASANDSLPSASAPIAAPGPCRAALGAEMESTRGIVGEGPIVHQLEPHNLNIVPNPLDAPPEYDAPPRYDAPPGYDSPPEYDIGSYFEHEGAVTFETLSQPPPATFMLELRVPNLDNLPRWIPRWALRRSIKAPYWVVLRVPPQVETPAPLSPQSQANQETPDERRRRIWNENRSHNLYSRFTRGELLFSDVEVLSPAQIGYLFSHPL